MKVVRKVMLSFTFTGHQSKSRLKFATNRTLFFIVVAFICGTGRSANGQDSECINPVWSDSGIVRQSVDGQGSMDVYWFYASGVSASVSLI